jgi:hypothetical protein
MVYERYRMDSLSQSHRPLPRDLRSELLFAVEQISTAAVDKRPGEP